MQLFVVYTTLHIKFWKQIIFAIQICSQILKCNNFWSTGKGQFAPGVASAFACVFLLGGLVGGGEGGEGGGACGGKEAKRGSGGMGGGRSRNRQGYVQGIVVTV